MTSRYQNLVGALAWIATRDGQASDDLNAAWNKVSLKDEATTKVERVIAAVYLTQASGLDRLNEVRMQLRDACAEGKIGAVGIKASGGDTSPIPVTSWLGVDIDEAAGTIGRGGVATWDKVSFLSADLRKCWLATMSAPPPSEKKRTGPPYKYRDELEIFARRHHEQVLRAIERGDEPPARESAEAIAHAMSKKYGHVVSPRTVRHNLAAIDKSAMFDGA